MAAITIRQLLDAGVHFGHQTRRWNPKVKRFILTERSGIHIIDLQQSLAYIDKLRSPCLSRRPAWASPTSTSAGWVVC